MAYHPQAQALLDGMAESGAPPLTEMTPEEARGIEVILAEMVGEGPDVASVEDIEIPGPAGAIPARVYEPVPDPPGTVVYYHGGGWVAGSLDGWDALCRALAVAAGTRLISVDYRLAPEHRFPAATDDAFAALTWIAERYPGQPLVVAGDSAGGNLATVSALRAREAGGPEIALQVLVYPVVDCDFTRPSYVECTAQHDPLRDECLAYAAALEAAGVPVTVARHDDQIHVFFYFVNLMESADRTVADAGAAIREAVAVKASA